MENKKQEMQQGAGDVAPGSVQALCNQLEALTDAVNQLTDTIGMLADNMNGAATLTEVGQMMGDVLGVSYPIGG